MTDGEEHPPAATAPATPDAPTARTADGLVPLACVLALVGLAVTVLHFVMPSPLMFTLFMTVGQGSFALAMAVYLFVIFADLRRRNVL